MKVRIVRAVVFMGLLLAAVLLLPAEGMADSGNQSDDQVARGEYLATVSGCIGCHTTQKPDYQDMVSLTPDDIRDLAFFERDAADEETHLLAGGRPFDLGPAGVLFAANITPDEETGIGSWTDEEIKVAIRTGLRPDGTILFPIMPYPNFNQLADEDLDAILAYLKTVPAVSNQVPPRPEGLTEGMQPLPFLGAVQAPDKADNLAYGEYLVRHVLNCSDCHTSINPDTGQPNFEAFLAGGQPFEGPWGIVYGANITPHEETGIGSWTDEDIRRVMSAGINKDGRRLALMPWQYYAELSGSDMDAAVTYLMEGLPAVENEVPQASLAEGFEEIVPISDEASEESEESSNSLLYGVLFGLVVAVVAAVLLARRRTTTNKKPPAV